MGGQFRVRGSLVNRAALFLIAFSVGVFLVSGRQAAADDADALSTEDLRSLEIAFGLLDNSLSAESELKWLVIFKKLTFQGPAEQVEAVMKRIQVASESRLKEFRSLRKLEPPVTGSPPPSPMGDAIEAAAQEAGTEELIFSSGVFNIRFLFLQAQATRMISVVAEQAAKVDPNEKRSQWLREVSSQFENYRDDLVEIAKLCSIK
ncbi:MAG: hypothetical protein VX252_08580 [Myxococcota bacterium]|nr:hypothetical protein [Myxococcota bacterium]